MAKRVNKKGLTYKQDLVIKDVVAKVQAGKSMNLLESVEKIYDVKNRNSARQVVNFNMKNTNFREALVASLIEKKILGADSVTEDKLIEGLDATKNGQIDYEARLRYIQEVNKLGGMYAPETRKNLNLNVDMTEEELDKRIKELQEQLE